MEIDANFCEHIGLSQSKAMLSRRPEWVAGMISEFDQPLWIGLTKLLRPKRIVEIGVASGWSGALFVDALQSNGTDAEYIGVDLSPDYYLDRSRKTGAAIDELFPEKTVNCRLILGKPAIDAVDEIGHNIDLAFIDGDHMHPWAMLDFLTLLPRLATGAWVLLHDLNLSTYARHNNKNRGPKYFFESWPYQKLHSSQRPPMIGAVCLPQVADDMLLTILWDTTHTPWEVPVNPDILNKIGAGIGQRFGAEWGARFAAAFKRMNGEIRQNLKIAAIQQANSPAAVIQQQHA
jgi:predicted O-methyltransferase YrrM